MATATKSPVKQFKIKSRVEVTLRNDSKVRGFVTATKDTPTGPFYEVTHGDKKNPLTTWARPGRMRAF